ncbi:TPA: CdiI family contact-dependent growth inhibition immunity protein [Proteus mirabilis]|uniref:contact-dependent growth inhibition system immunity protein n=2 Tax=Morganellaceae TaxID=1903414 RepID=UPI0029F1A52F|nr:CdiI family contact-dependent growth inhibition immunity protein [Proteus mirabilis]HEJ9662509.1 CdiI family contact-dependent growth inhibition immunity protein [Proteus mirabilis]HEK1721361.1 CdiI family contact-dependent growth inhibition immunity protein [Proteus mirabilis]HEK2725893.1 CdiI family contact-dependent growth inhibition immunity protein [Proteus mirabilis]
MIKSKYYNLYADVYFNNDYYIIVTISGCYIHFTDFKYGYKILSNDITNAELGYYSKIFLMNSREIESNSQEFHEMYTDKKSYPEWIKKIVKEYGYKNKTALFENMNLCSLSVVGNEIIIRPQNHLRMDHWVGEGIPDSAIITLKANCSDEVLGASIKKAFTRCISCKV